MSRGRRLVFLALLLPSLSPNTRPRVTQLQCAWNEKVAVLAACGPGSLTFGTKQTSLCFSGWTRCIFWLELEMARSAGLGAGHVENWEGTVLLRVERLGGRPRSPGSLGWERSSPRKCSRNPSVQEQRAPSLLGRLEDALHTHDSHRNSAVHAGCPGCSGCPWSAGGSGEGASCVWILSPVFSRAHTSASRWTELLFKSPLCHFLAV